MALAMAAGARSSAEDWNPFLPLLEEVTVGQIYMPAIDCKNTVTALAAAAEESAEAALLCPPVNARLLATYLDYYQQQGFVAGAPAVSIPESIAQQRPLE